MDTRVCPDYNGIAMNTVKTAIIILILLIAVSLVIYFIPFDKVLSNIPYFNKLYNNTSLTINSKNGKSSVNIGGKDYGQTPVTITDLNSGDYDVVLTRISESKDSYVPLNVSITLEKGAESIIDMEIGPSGINAGYILYYTKSLTSSENNGLITLLSEPDGSNIYLDDQILGKAPIKATKLNAKNYQIKITKQGYEDLSFPVIVRNGYNLNIQTTLYPLPTILKK